MPWTNTYVIAAVDPLGGVIAYHRWDAEGEHQWVKTPEDVPWYTYESMLARNVLDGIKRERAERPAEDFPDKLGGRDYPLFQLRFHTCRWT